MRVSRSRFSKRRSKRKTSFPVIAVVQKKTKPRYSFPEAFGELNKNSEQLEKRGDALASETVRGKKVKTKSREISAKKSRATIDYKNVVLLRKLITAEGKILPRRINKLTAKQQRHTQKAIKSARVMGLLPFINKSRPLV